MCLLIEVGSYTNELRLGRPVEPLQGSRLRRDLTPHVRFHRRLLSLNPFRVRRRSLIVAPPVSRLDIKPKYPQDSWLRGDRRAPFHRWLLLSLYPFKVQRWVIRHCSFFIPHYSSFFIPFFIPFFITHCSLLITHYSLLTAGCSLLTDLNSPASHSSCWNIPSRADTKIPVPHKKILLRFVHPYHERARR